MRAVSAMTSASKGRPAGGISSDETRGAIQPIISTGMAMPSGLQQIVSPYRDLQRHHAHPEHRFIADIDIVCARESQLAFVADAEYRQTSGERLDRVGVAHIDRQIVLRDQHSAAR